MTPSKTIRQNEVPFGRDTRVVPRNTVLDRGSGPPGSGDLEVGPPVRSDAAYRQISLAVVRHLLRLVFVLVDGLFFTFLVTTALTVLSEVCKQSRHLQ